MLMYIKVDAHCSCSAPPKQVGLLRINDVNIKMYFREIIEVYLWNKVT